MSPELIAHIKRCKAEYDSWPDWKKASVVLQGDTMFGFDELKGKLNAETEARREQDRAQFNELFMLQSKLRALEEYLDIEFKTYPTSSQYIKSTKGSKL
jgi:hypothetical protein